MLFSISYRAQYATVGRLGLDTEIVAYCRGPYCIYAHQAVATLRARGLNARRMDGGLPEWRKDGRVIETTG